MSLEFAVLGFLNYQPFSGYDLKKTFDNSVSHFWPADQSQIYRTLARLAAGGKAEIEVIDQPDRPDRKLNHITAAGRAELMRWLVSQLPYEEARSPQLVQVFFAASLPDEAALKIFEDGAAYLRGMLSAYDGIPAVVEEYTRQIGSPRDAFFWGLTLESGLVAARANLEWLESVAARIRAGQVPPPTPKPQE